MAELKKEVEQDDPMELMGMLAPGDADSDERQAEAMVEEFLLMGYPPEAVMDLFRAPHYQATHRLWCQRGEPWVRGILDQVVGSWRSSHV